LSSGEGGFKSLLWVPLAGVSSKLYTVHLLSWNE